jgi:Ca2+-binding RTX toxin-like protein
MAHVSQRRSGQLRGPPEKEGTPLPPPPPGSYPVYWTGTDAPESKSGSIYADRLDGRGGDDKLTGGLGNDTIEGAYGNDQILPDLGADIVNAGDGSDKIYASKDGSVDVIDGGPGDDLVTYFCQGTLEQSRDQLDQLRNVEHVIPGPC